MIWRQPRQGKWTTTFEDSSYIYICILPMAPINHCTSIWRQINWSDLQKSSDAAQFEANAFFSCHLGLWKGQGRIRQSPLKLAKKNEKDVRCESYLNTTASWMNRSLTNKQHQMLIRNFYTVHHDTSVYQRNKFHKNPNQSQHHIKTRGKWLNMVAAQKQYSHLWLLRLLRLAWCD